MHRAIIGILIAQLLWTKEAFNLEEKKFSQKVHIALLEVVKKLYEGTTSELPAENPIKKVANDYYIVNIDNDFEPDILEYYLKTEFAKFNINTDYEYAMYNCESDEMVYGNYISFSNKNETNPSKDEWWLEETNKEDLFHLMKPLLPLLHSNLCF